MIAAVLVSCKKNTTDTPAPSPEQQMQEVTFDINTILESPDRAYDVPNCIPEIDNEVNKYAEIIIEDASGELQTHFAEIYYVDGLPYTKAIMLPVTDDDDDCDTYWLREFYVWDNNGTPGYDSERDDDILFKAAPLHFDDQQMETAFWKFAVNTVDQEFQVCAFFKTKIKIDVLCFIPDNYDLFGFFWFEITEITVREMCFFGDFCLKDISMYNYPENEYYQSGGGVFIDEAAIFEIRAQHKVGDGDWDDMVGTPFNNVGWLGVGEPLCVRYPDYDAEIDYYKFDLYLWAMVGDQMGWVYLYTFEWQDAFEVGFPELGYDPGSDGVYEFVVGNCVSSPTDLLLPPYMNLPASGQMYLASPANPGNNTGAYWDVKFDGFGAGYDIVTGVWYDGWCGDKYTTIGYGWHDVLFYTTLDPVAGMPTPNTLTDRKLEQFNYLFNHYKSNGIDIYAPGLMAPEDMLDIQESIWMVAHAGTGQPFTPTSTLAAAMGSEALSSLSEGYKILPGGDAGVLMFKQAPTRAQYIAQLVLVVVDP
jgi:hypothetical protein